MNKGHVPCSNMRCKNSAWMDGIPNGNGHSIDAVRCAMMEDVPRG